MLVKENYGLYEADFTVSELHLDAKGFDLMAKFWSSLRKRIRENIGLDVVATFNTKNAPHIHCMMIPSRVNSYGTDYDDVEFTAKSELLKEKLPNFLDLFLKSLEDFKKSPEYKTYCELVKKETEFKNDCVFHEIINPFLIRSKLKTFDDEIRKEEIRRQREAASNRE